MAENVKTVTKSEINTGLCHVSDFIRVDIESIWNWKHRMVVRSYRKLLHSVPCFQFKPYAIIKPGLVKYPPLSSTFFDRPWKAANLRQPTATRPPTIIPHATTNYAAAEIFIGISGMRRAEKYLFSNYQIMGHYWTMPELLKFTRTRNLHRICFDSVGNSGKDNIGWIFYIKQLPSF